MSVDITTIRMIPGFVFRGIAVMSDDGNEVRYHTEADLRDALAAMWWMQGLEVRTEVDVPNCGRIDVMGETGHLRLVVELKRKITTPSDARKAFMQANAYKAYLDAEQPLWVDAEQVTTRALVTCGAYEYDAVWSADRVFSGVDFYDFYGAARGVSQIWFVDAIHREDMRIRAAERMALIRRLSSLASGHVGHISRASENDRFPRDAFLQEVAS